MVASHRVVSRHSTSPFQTNAVVCGFVLRQSAVLSQMLDFMTQMIDSKQVNVVAIIDKSEAHTALMDMLPQSDNYASLLTDTDDLTSVDWLKLVFVQESNFDELFRFNVGVIKVGLPHGTDIALKTTLVKYGGCLEFDYVLCHSGYPPMFDHAFAGRFPHELRSHSRNYCCAIPFGMPKFDKFLQACLKQPDAADIIYHLSYLKIESTDVIKKIPIVLEKLLAEFPDRQIVFRPYPEDLQHPLIQRVIKRFKNKANFKLSASASYIDDYAKGALMVCHRDYTRHLFVQASGRPVLLIKDNITELIGQIHHELTTVQLGALDTLVHNPGGSVAYLLKNLSYITEDRIHPDWQYFSLNGYDGISAVNSVLSGHLDPDLPFHKVALAAHRREGTVNTLIACIISLSRSPLLNNSDLAKQSWDYAITLCVDWVRRHDVSTEQWQLMQSALAAVNGQFREYFVTQLLHSTDIEIPLVVKEKIRTLLFCRQPLVDDVEREYKIVSVDQQHYLESGPVQLYGAGQLAQKVLLSETFCKRFTVVNVVDQSKALHGKSFFKQEIAAPDSLNHFNEPVIICSQAFFEEIHWSLINVYGVKNKIYRLA